MSFIKHHTFIETKFITSIKTVSDKININLIVTDDDKLTSLIGNDIYFIITSTNLNIYTAHKFYDAKSIFYILSLVDTVYNNGCENLPDYILPNNNISEQHLFRNLFFKLNKNKSSELIFSKEYITNKSIDIINDIQNTYPEHNMLIVVNTRKNLSLHENTIGNYVDTFFLEKGNKNFIDLLKKMTTVSDIVDTTKNMNIFDKNICFNSYLNYTLPSFLHEMIYLQINTVKYILDAFVTPKNSNGIAKLYFVRN